MNYVVIQVGETNLRDSILLQHFKINNAETFTISCNSESYTKDTASILQQLNIKCEAVGCDITIQQDYITIDEDPSGNVILYVYDHKYTPMLRTIDCPVYEYARMQSRKRGKPSK